MRGDLYWRLKPAWYILLYHDVSWEENTWLRHIGGGCPPDVFEDHVRFAADVGEIVGVEEGLGRLADGKIDHPLISFWFDDGFASVSQIAAPILDDAGAAGATSICSRFVERREMFWRLKLSHLHAAGCDDELRSLLRCKAPGGAPSIRQGTMDQFDLDLVARLDEIYAAATSERQREDAFGLFETPDSLAALARSGWVIANHSAAHYPIGEPHVADMTISQFEECDGLIESLTGRRSRFWVFPFDRNIDPAAVEELRRSRADVTPVLVRDRANTPAEFARNPVLHRINAPAKDRDGLAAALLSAAQTLN
jgi:peptidoglycan/xylan/chitin deacetylase (PgdA/CDA1 family)